MHWPEDRPVWLVPGMDAGQVEEAFRQRFGRPPAYLVRAPGRVNLIGEHTDYNEGFVLPAAIDRYVLLAATPADEPLLRFRALHYDDEATIPLDRPAAAAVPPWGRYLQGVAIELRRAGVALRGLEAVIGGNLPVGAGLSSSAALEMAVAFALLAASSVALDRPAVALLARRAEEEFVGVRCGIMDQFTVALARAGCAIFLDCRSLEYAHVPLPDHLRLVVCDTGSGRALGGSGYNARRQECEEAVAALRPLRPGIRALRDITPDHLSLAARLPEPLGRRVRHVVTENGRVREAVAALRRGDGPALGRLLAASHASLRDDFAVSTPALDAMASAAAAVPGCLGARLVGAGFGGAVLALVAQSATADFVSAAASAYHEATGSAGTFYPCEPVGGVEVTATGDQGGKS